MLAMQIMDQLERDYHDIYPEDPPVIDEGFEEALKNVVLKMGIRGTGTSIHTIGTIYSLKNRYLCVA